MSHSRWISVHHVVFSTKKRVPFLKASVRQRLFPLLGRLAQQQGIRVIEFGGGEDHVHLLVAFSATHTPSVCIQKLKANSSRWLKELSPSLQYFAWQAGYSGSSVCPRHSAHVAGYIRQQEAHHLHDGFLNELRQFLDDREKIAALTDINEKAKDDG